MNWVTWDYFAQTFTPVALILLCVSVVGLIFAEWSSIGHFIAHRLGGIVCDPRCGEHIWPVCGCPARVANMWGETTDARSSNREEEQK